MAQITYSDDAPAEKPNSFSIANFEPFTPPFDTDDADLLAAAKAHPWLAVVSDGPVEEPEPVVEPVVGGYEFPNLSEDN